MSIMLQCSQKFKHFFVKFNTSYKIYDLDIELYDLNIELHFDLQCTIKITNKHVVYLFENKVHKLELY